MPTLTPASTNLAVSCVRDSKSGAVILKLVNLGTAAQSLQVRLSGGKQIAPTAMKTVLAADSAAVNALGKPAVVLPQAARIPVGETFACEVPAHSLTVIRLEPR
jgi:alpha-L-arabinofuranosidase